VVVAGVFAITAAGVATIAATAAAVTNTDLKALRLIGMSLSSSHCRRTATPFMNPDKNFRRSFVNGAVLQIEVEVVSNTSTPKPRRTKSPT
jgi:hypothetical protein